MYGQTEASPRISYCKINKNNFKNFIKPSVGKAILDGKIILKDEYGFHINKPFTEGEIIYEGPNIFCGYSKNFKDLSKLEKNKKLSTGDIAYYDQNKNYFIVGRKNRIAKLYGIRYDLNEIENVIKKKTGILSICVNYKNKIYIFSEKKINTLKISNIPTSSLVFKKIIKIPRLSNGKVDIVKLNNKINEKYKKIQI